MPATQLSKYLQQLHDQNAYRTRQLIQGPQAVTVTLNNKSYISFCSNDYLGLANDPRVCAATKHAIDAFGVGTGASQLISGYSAAHAQLEEQLAAFFNYPRCVLFSSGYLANLGVITSFGDKHSVVVQDKLNHASLIDAASYADSKLKRYRHRDVEHAINILSKLNNAANLLVTDGVFSMEGSIAPLKQLITLKDNTHSKLIVDDAHGIGVLGANGKGSMEHENVSASEIDILIGTLGKSFGASGAFVLSSNDAIEYLIQKARSLIYTTALPSALAVAATTSLQIIRGEPERRHRLHENIHYFRQCAQDCSLNLLDSITAIQSLVIGDNLKALSFSEKLKKQGILVLAIRPPTVPKNSARLRITLSSEHNKSHIDQLFSCLININKGDN